MLTNDGKYWVKGASRLDCWFAKFNNYDYVLERGRFDSGSALFYQLPITVIALVGIGILATILDESLPVVGYVFAVLLILWATFVLFIGILARRQERTALARVYDAAGEYRRLELRLLGANMAASKEHRKRLWQQREAINELLEESGRTDTAEWGLNIERRPKELERRQWMTEKIKKIYLAMGYSEMATNAAIALIMFDFNKEERARLSEYISESEQGIRGAEQLKVQIQGKLAVYRQVEDLMAKGM